MGANYIRFTLALMEEKQYERLLTIIINTMKKQWASDYQLPAV